MAVHMSSISQSVFCCILHLEVGSLPLMDHGTHSPHIWKAICAINVAATQDGEGDGVESCAL